MHLMHNDGPTTSLVQEEAQCQGIRVPPAASRQPPATMKKIKLESIRPRKAVDERHRMD